MCTIAASHDLDSLLRGFLAGKRDARDAFPRAAESYLLKLARQFAADLPEDLQREVVRQAFLNLMRQKPASFDPDRGSAGTFLKLMVRNASRQLRASYVSPGHVTRVRRVKDSGKSVSKLGPVIVSIDDLEEQDTPGVRGGSTVVEAQHDVEVILRRAAPSLVARLVRVLVDEESMDNVAANAGISRFTLSRQFTEFMREVRAAA